MWNVAWVSRVGDGPVIVRTIKQQSSVMVAPDRFIAIERCETGCVSLQRLYCSRIPVGNDCWHYMRWRPDLYGPLVGPVDKFNHYDELGYLNVELESILDLACQGGSK